MKILKEQLKERTFSLGTWLTIAHASVAEIMCDAGFDWIVIDLEHSATDLSELQRLIQVISLKGVTSLVRIGENNPNLIKRCLDCGAEGIIVAMVNTVEDAVKAVESAKYPPYGKRGVGLWRAQGYGFGFEQYKEENQKKGVVIAQIEHIDAIRNLEAILDVEGLDGTIVGPYDLSGSLGYPGEFERQDVKDALNRYEDICNSKGKPLGFHVVSSDWHDLKDYVKRGYKFLAFGLDAMFLGEKARGAAANINKLVLEEEE